MAFVVSAVAEAVGGGILGAMAGGAVMGGGIAAITGGDVLKGALMGGVTGGIGAGVAGALGGALGGTGQIVMDTAGTQQAVQSLTDNFITAGQSEAEAYQNAVSQLASSTGTDASTINSVMSGQSAGYTGQLSTAGTAGLPTNVANQLGKLAANALVGGGASLAGGLLQSNAALTAAQQKAAGATQAANILSPAYTQAAALQSTAQTGGAATAAQGYKTGAEQQVSGLTAAQTAADTTLAGQKALQQPYQAAGTAALDTLSAGLAPGGKFNTPFSTADMTNVMPAFTFAEKQAQAAMTAKMASGGQNLSSNAIEGAGTLAAGLASQYEGQAFNQWLQQNNLSLGALQNMVATGQISTGQIATALQQQGVSSQTIQTAIGQVTAAGTRGAADVTAAGQIGAAGAQAGGVMGAAGAQAAGVMGASGATAAGTIGSANALNSMIGNIGSNAAVQNTLGSILGQTVTAPNTAGQVPGVPNATPSNAVDMTGFQMNTPAVSYFPSAPSVGSYTSPDSSLGVSAMPTNSSYSLGSGMTDYVLP